MFYVRLGAFARRVGIWLQRLRSSREARVEPECWTKCNWLEPLNWQEPRSMSAWGRRVGEGEGGTPEEARSSWWSCRREWCLCAASRTCGWAGPGTAPTDCNMHGNEHITLHNLHYTTVQLRYSKTRMRHLHAGSRRLRAPALAPLCQLPQSCPDRTAEID